MCFWEGSQLLHVGDDEAIKQAFGVQPKDNEVFVPKGHEPKEANYS